MAESLETLNQKMNSARELVQVVGTLKALAGAQVAQLEQAVRSLQDYYRTVLLGLSVWRSIPSVPQAWKLESPYQAEGKDAVLLIVLASDQGMAGPFNQVLAARVLKDRRETRGSVRVWTLGERINGLLEEGGLVPDSGFMAPRSLQSINPLVAVLLERIRDEQRRQPAVQIDLYYNHPLPGSLYEPACQSLFPGADFWDRELSGISWPGSRKPEPMYGAEDSREAFIREFLFVSLFRACADSLASENLSRLASMQRAERNIRDWLEELRFTYHRLRQDTIDEELFDVISGSAALNEGGFR